MVTNVILVTTKTLYFYIIYIILILIGDIPMAQLMIILTMKGASLWKKVIIKILVPNVVVTIVIIMASFAVAGTKVAVVV